MKTETWQIETGDAAMVYECIVVEATEHSAKLALRKAFGRAHAYPWGESVLPTVATLARVVDGGVCRAFRTLTRGAS